MSDSSIPVLRPFRGRSLRFTRRSVILAACGAAAATTLRSSSRAQAPIVATMVAHSQGAGDRAFDALAETGGMDAARELGIMWNVIESSDSSAYAANVQAAAEVGGLTIGVGSQMADAIALAAPKFLDKSFLLVDAVVEGPNVASIVFRAQESAFLAGVVAAWTTTTNRVGIIGGQEGPDIERAEYGFRAAIQAENPDCVVSAVYADSFEDPARGKELALALFDDGVDIVFSIAGETGLGAYEAASERGAGHWVIGSDIDREAAVPGVQLCVARKGIDLAVFDAAKAVVDGAFVAGIQELGLAEDGVSLDSPGDRVEPAILARVSAYRSRIIVGEFSIPTSGEQLNTWATPAPASPAEPCDCFG